MNHALTLQQRLAIEQIDDPQSDVAQSWTQRNFADRKGGRKSHSALTARPAAGPFKDSRTIQRPMISHCSFVWMRAGGALERETEMPVASAYPNLFDKTLLASWVRRRADDEEGLVEVSPHLSDGRRDIPGPASSSPGSRVELLAARRSDLIRHRHDGAVARLREGPPRATGSLP